MQMLVITGARLADGKPVALKVGRYHTVTHVWITEPAELPVERLVAEMQGGNRAFTMFQKDGRNLPGQELHVVSDGAGAWTVAPVALKPGVMLEDLPSF